LTVQRINILAGIGRTVRVRRQERLAQDAIGLITPANVWGYFQHGGDPNLGQ
jgi:hypothetical protein